uniref:Ig-like domain-containing protein n=1 Tax=Vombatus ursinus TaxID=29139 RepID=A0A4X2K6K9_VOMUR
ASPSGLCLSQKITAPEGTLLRPSIRAVPSSVVPKGAEVKLYCQGPQGSKSVQLWKDEAFSLQINTSREEAEFRLQRERISAAGSYSCRYWQGLHWSEFSAPLQLVVTGFFSRPSLQVRPSTMVAVGETVTLVCQELINSSFSKLAFFLLKAGMPAPLQHQSPEGKMASFTLPSVKAEDAGNYSCVYSDKANKRASDPSDVLMLEVTDYTAGNLIRLSLAGLVLLILGVLLAEAWHSQRGS